MRVLSIGEVLWDVFPDREFLGGAPLNVCANLERAGDEARLLSAVGADAHGDAVLQTMHQLHLAVDLIQRTSAYPTGTATVVQDENGEPSFSITRPAAFDALILPDQVLRSILEFGPDWVYMGTLLQTSPDTEALVARVLNSLSNTRCFYDMNLRPGHWELPLVERLCRLASVLKLNEVEAQMLFGLSAHGAAPFSLEEFCCTWQQRFDLDVICVTLGPAGCYVHTKGETRRESGYPVAVSDTVGAGDAFAAAFLHGYHRGWPLARCARLANSLGALVASRPGATPEWTMQECEMLIKTEQRS